MKYKVMTILSIVFIFLSGCNREVIKSDLTQVELHSDDVVLGALCNYEYSEAVQGSIDAILIYADGRICIGNCPKEVGEIYSEFLGKVRGSDASAWSVLEDTEKVACLSKEEMETLIKYTQSIDLDYEEEKDTIEDGKMYPQPEPAVEDIFNWYIYFCYQWDDEHIPTYYPLTQSGDENALEALEFLLQNKNFQEWYDTCEKITWEATQVWDE